MAKKGATSNLDAKTHKKNGDFAKGNNANPTGKGGFSDNPQNRSTGHWKKEDTARYKFEMMSKMTEAELFEIANDKSESKFIRNMAVEINNGDLDAILKITNQIYGNPKDSVDMNLDLDEKIPIITGFVLPVSPEDFIDENGKQKPQE